MAVSLAPLLLGLRYAVIGGQDDPPVLAPRRPGWLRRAVPGALGLLTFGLALNVADTGSVHGTLTQLIWVLSVVPLAVLVYRPLVAWRIAWLAGLVAVLGLEHYSQWYPGQAWIFLLVLFGVATAQRQEVMLPVWLASLALTWVGVDEAGRAAAVLVVTGVVVWGYLIRRRLQAQSREQGGEANRPSRRSRLLATVSWVPPAVVQLRRELVRALSSSWIVNDLPRALIRGPDDPLSLGRTARSRYLIRLGIMIAALLVALVAGSTAAGRGEPTLVALWPLSAAPLVVMMYRPLLAWRLGWVLGLLGLLLAPPVSHTFHLSPALITVFLLVLFVVGTIQPPGVLVWVWLATLPLALPGVDLGKRPGAIVLVTGILLGGYQVQRWRQARERLAEAQEQGTVLTERARIARELHDVVAHHMSMIAVRTETAPYRLPDLPESAQIEFAEISQASREALTEMRRLLGVLRSDEPAVLTAPQPGLADLQELIASARAAGTEVTMDVDATLPELPAAVDVSAYRIVQEALTNAARHALGAPVRVVVGRTAGTLALSVRNGPGRVPGQDGGPGHGVRGMRERVAMLGGELRAGPDGDGGFEVSALLPLQGIR